MFLEFKTFFIMENKAELFEKRLKLSVVHLG